MVDLLQHIFVGYVFWGGQGIFADLFPSLHLLLAEHKRA